VKLIAGLGNPGDKYHQTRHNVGFMVVDRLAEKINMPDWTDSQKFMAKFTNQGELIFVKPQTFMNKSGEAIKKLANHYKIDTGDIWIVHDDLDISLGEYKIQKGKGPREHNGVDSVEVKLGVDFWRVRVGVENREGERVPGESYVLQEFEDEELVIMDRKIDDIVDHLLKIVEE
jgi:PTH1 family peptidyl-tRNA hydrolase